MSQIKAGDLVVVVGAHCRHGVSVIGTLWRVSSIQSKARYKCGCGEIIDGIAAIKNLDENGHPRGELVSYLKRIPPLDELEREQEKKEIEA